MLNQTKNVKIYIICLATLRTVCAFLLVGSGRNKLRNRLFALVLRAASDASSLNKTFCSQSQQPLCHEERRMQKSRRARLLKRAPLDRVARNSRPNGRRRNGNSSRLSPASSRIRALSSCEINVFTAIVFASPCYQTLADREEKLISSLVLMPLHRFTINRKLRVRAISRKAAHLRTVD